MSDFRVFAFYHFVAIEHPQTEVKTWQRFLSSLDIRGRIYLSHEGINGVLSADSQAAERFIAWLKAHPLFSSLKCKIDLHKEHAFAKLQVKVREQLVAFDQNILHKGEGEHLSPKDWKKMLEEKDENTILLDVRNNYESTVGHFEGAILPDLETFREFPEYGAQLAKEYEPSKTKVMMYCTGGIRCEYYSTFLKEKGFESIYQLDGGVIQYGKDEGDSHWIGRLFVFDDRLTVPIDEKGGDIISFCHSCETKSDVYYNCANMDCNELFLSCAECAEKMRGCCSKECVQAPRIRPFERAQKPKPFRKLSFVEKQKLCD